MLTTQLPQPKDVRDMLSGLLGRDVTLNVTDPPDHGPGKPVSYGAYVDDRLKTAAVVVADLAMTAYAGAAIGLIPAGGAQDAVKERSLPPMLTDNLGEVLNVLAALFNAEGAPHLKLYASYPPGTDAPPDVIALGKAIGNRLDLAVDIPGYGAGTLSLVLSF
jgi:hypothetical protein